jgi:uncharacterized membrane protein
LAYSVGSTPAEPPVSPRGDLQTKAIRRTAVRHALLSYVFGAGIVATTVNLVASLTAK